MTLDNSEAARTRAPIMLFRSFTFITWLLGGLGNKSAGGAEARALCLFSSLQILGTIDGMIICLIEATHLHLSGEYCTSANQKMSVRIRGHVLNHLPVKQAYQNAFLLKHLPG